MTRKRDIDVGTFDSAMIDAFRKAPRGGEFGEMDALWRRRRMNQILEATPPNSFPAWEKKLPVPRLKRIRWGWIAAAALLAAMIAGYLVWASSVQVNKEVNLPPSPKWFGEVMNAGPKVTLDGKAVLRRSLVPVGKDILTHADNALLQMPTGIDWWMSSHSAARIESADRQIAVAVGQGESWFRVDPTRSGPPFVVKTHLGEIRITGTIFVVKTTPSDVTVSLLKGQVSVMPNDGTQHRLKAGEMMSLANGHKIALAPADMKRCQLQLKQLAWQTVTEQSQYGAAGTLAPAVNHTEKRSKSGSQAARTSKVEKTSVERLHRAIQTARQGGDWRETASLYQQLIQAAPGSDAAWVSRVSLGEVYLSKLHQYNNAMRQFDRYIRSGHRTLLPEALYGKCTALGLLKNNRGEERCLKAFVQQFPAEFRAPEARARIEKLAQNAN